MKIIFYISTLLWSICGLSQIEFSPTGGIFEGPIDVTLKGIDEESVIYYTLDGSSPNSSSFKYTNPIHVKDIGVIRAVIYSQNQKHTVQTQSYFCDREYSLPVISVTSNPDNFWNYSTGIYVKGCCADSIEPYLGANFWKSWEKPCNIEMYDKNGELCFNQKAGMSLFGGYSRSLPQKSLAIIARSKYGHSKFEYPIFDERKSKKYKSFILRNSGGDFKRTHIRDAYMTQLMAPTGLAIQAYEPAIVFLNGKYWGIQNIREKISEHYLAQNFGVDKNNVDILRQNGVRRHGYSKNYKRLLYYLRTHDLSKDEYVQELSKFMDIKDFISYNIAEVYSDNRDAGGNIRYFRERTDSAKWRWVFYDLDLGLGNNNYKGYKRNTLKKFTSVNAEAWPDPSWSTFIIRKLLENKNLRYQYINTTCDFLNTTLSADQAVTLLNNIIANIETEMPYHVKRWNTSITNWQFHVDVVRTYVTERPKYLREHLKQKFKLGEEIKVNIKVPELDICKITFNTLKISENFSGIYFKDVPLTIEVIPHHDYEFVGWKNRAEKTNKITVIPSGEINLEPLIRAKTKSIFSDSIIINEISFYQPKPLIVDTVIGKLDDWIELYNNTNTSINLDSFVITKSKFKKGFVIPNGYNIAANDYLIITKNKQSFIKKYNIDSNKVVGNMTFGLSKKGASLKFYDAFGFVVDSLTYKGITTEVDSLFTVSLTFPDSIRNNQNNWNFEKPTPYQKSANYSKYLYEEEIKMIWKKRLYIGGGSFFFISLLGILLYRYSKKKRNN